MQDPTTTTTTPTDSSVPPAGAAAASTPQTPAVNGGAGNGEVEALKAEMTRLQANLDRIKDDEKAERQKRQQAQEANGEFKALAEQLKADKLELETKLSTLSQKAAYAEQLESGFKSRIDARLANGLPEYVKTAVRNARDLSAQLEVLDAFDREVGGAATKTTTASAPASGTTNAEKIDFPARMAAGESLDVLKAKYPQQWAEYRGSPTSESKPSGGVSSYMSALFRKKG